MHTTLKAILNYSPCSIQFSYHKYWDMQSQSWFGSWTHRWHQAVLFLRDKSTTCRFARISPWAGNERGEGFPSRARKDLSAACLTYVPSRIHSSWALCCQPQWSDSPHTSRNRAKAQSLQPEFLLRGLLSAVALTTFSILFPLTRLALSCQHTFLSTTSANIGEVGDRQHAYLSLLKLEPIRFTTDKGKLDNVTWVYGELGFFLHPCDLIVPTSHWQHWLKSSLPWQR